jgi:hypothetical protein
MDVDAILQMNEGNSRNTSDTFVSVLLATHAIGGQEDEMKDYIDLAQRPFLYFWRLATRCPEVGSGSCS